MDASVDARVCVIHADAWLLVVEKQPGLLSVPGRLAEHHDSVAARVQLQFPDARIVHRLDQVTSGAMVLALDADTHRVLSKAFAARQVGKRYEALVEGEVDGESGEIDLPLIADWPNRPRQKIDPVDGKPSHTRWSVVERGTREGRPSTRLALEPTTGRTHQLRVHLAAIGHPIVGDVFYGAAPASRVCLHAAGIAFAHPATGQQIEFVSPVPF